LAREVPETVAEFLSSLVVSIRRNTNSELLAAARQVSFGAIDLKMTIARVDDVPETQPIFLVAEKVKAFPIAKI